MANSEEKDDLLEEQQSEAVEETKNTDVTEASAMTDDVKADKKPKKTRKLTIHLAHVAKLKVLANKYWTKKKWTIPITVLVLLLIILAIPYTRWMTLGTVLKSQATVTVTDSVTHAPVSGAIVSLGGKSLKTDAYGKVVDKPNLGSYSLSVSKQYYQSAQKSVTVTFSKSHNAFTLSIVANGRQVPITVTNKVTGKPLANAVIKVLSTEAKTDKLGKAIVVLPTAKATQQATLSLAGFNDTTGTVSVTDKDVATNHFTLTPAGKLYFLSNQSGKIDVVKTSLDGTDRQTVLAGTGSEDPNTTSLLASRDWKYLALLSQRASGDQSINLIDTTNGDKVTNIDEGKDVYFSLVGWSDDTFVYQVTRSTVPDWQPNQDAIKSYDAAAGKLYIIDQTTGVGTTEYAYARTEFGTVSILDNELVYTISWHGDGDYDGHGNTKNDSLMSVKPDGSGKKSLKDFPVPVDSNWYGYFSYYINSEQYKPYALYIQVPSSDGTSNTYYSYENDKLTQSSTITNDTYNQSGQDAQTYLLSPSDKQTFWGENRDGKITLFVGDANGDNGKQIASLSDYQTYGWYSDNYLLLSKNSSELYILPADGSSTTPQKITDYYKPPTSYRGYGGGYGGI